MRGIIHACADKEETIDAQRTASTIDRFFFFFVAHGVRDICH